MRNVVHRAGGMFSSNVHAAIGVGSLIIFIAMIISAGVAASVVMQTMNTMQQQALQTSRETISDISTGLRLTHTSGYVTNGSISQLCFFLTTIPGSNAVDLSQVRLQISDGEMMPVLSYANNSFSTSVSSGLFKTLNMSNVTNEKFGLLVIRDLDNSCSGENPVINENDLVAIIINTTACFNELSPRTTVTGRIVPEQGISAMFSFTTPSSYNDNIIDL
ncbi:MAG: flagellin [Candidatus Thermoplasmatota archaeon]|nr:flagellin [Candidatus Thermoplasmatota archaeon]